MQRFPNIRLPTVGVHHFMLIGVIGFIGSCSPDHGGHNYNKNQRPVFHVLFSSLVLRRVCRVPFTLVLLQAC